MKKFLPNEKRRSTSQADGEVSVQESSSCDSREGLSPRRRLYTDLSGGRTVPILGQDALGGPITSRPQGHQHLFSEN